MTEKQRYVTYIKVCEDDVKCLTQEEFHEFKAKSDIEVAGDFWDEWVWQFATSKEEAISNHFIKMDEWHSDPEKETY